MPLCPEDMNRGIGIQTLQTPISGPRSCSYEEPTRHDDSVKSGIRVDIHKIGVVCGIYNTISMHYTTLKRGQQQMMVVKLADKSTTLSTECDSYLFRVTSFTHVHRETTLF